ncbi:MAG: septal ring lytic transglycosylase RlpA family protein [Betaproteobacteria bacterium]|nr:septal ring lytic transglycosylase RlpA family protein [Betaproteobacteria bacterium]MBI3935432.1 septal ring lytic transglycosylase RlpA family protein [Betaproteobacteria bacterium]
MSACGTVARRDAPRAERTPTTVIVPAPRGGGYYLDDGPGDGPPADLDSVAEPEPKWEPLHRGASRPYTVLGRSYAPMTGLAPYRARGLATWYGRRYHGKQTSSGEIYNMYGMSAAHPILPIPSYARITNLQNNRSVVVRINDRGPFVDDRLIDLSYAAAYKLGLLPRGSGMVEVEAIIPDGAPATAVASAGGTRGAWRPEKPQSSVAPPQEEAAASAAPSKGEAGSAPAPVTADASGVFLQFGAFGSKDNAESYLARLQAQFEWLAQALHIFTRDGLFRVHAGPYPSQSEARRAAQRIGEALGVRPMVLTR